MARTGRPRGAVDGAPSTNPNTLKARQRRAAVNGDPFTRTVFEGRSGDYKAVLRCFQQVGRRADYMVASASARRSILLDAYRDLMDVRCHRGLDFTSKMARYFAATGDERARHPPAPDLNAVINRWFRRHGLMGIPSAAAGPLAGGSGGGAGSDADAMEITDMLDDAGVGDDREPGSSGRAADDEVETKRTSKAKRRSRRRSDGNKDDAPALSRSEAERMAHDIEANAADLKALRTYVGAMEARAQAAVDERVADLEAYFADAVSHEVARVREHARVAMRAPPASTMQCLSTIEEAAGRIEEAVSGWLIGALAGAGQQPQQHEQGGAMGVGDESATGPVASGLEVLADVAVDGVEEAARRLRHAPEADVEMSAATDGGGSGSEEFFFLSSEV